MAKYLLTDGFVSVNGVDLSDHAFGISTPEETESVDVSGFSATGAKEFLAGQKTQSVTINFLQDFAASKVHATLQPLFTNRTTFPIIIRPTSAGASATNPSLSGSVQLNTYNGINGQLNARGEVEATFTASTTAGLTWGST